MKALFALLLAVAAARPAAAADVRSGVVGVMAACRSDLRQFCRPAPVGGPLKCLLDHKEEVQPDCRKALDSIKGLPAPAAPAAAGRPKSCLPEFTKVCSGAKSKDFKACINAHRSELSSYCRKMADAAGF